MSDCRCKGYGWVSVETGEPMPSNSLGFRYAVACPDCQLPPCEHVWVSDFGQETDTCDNCGESRNSC